MRTYIASLKSSRLYVNPSIEKFLADAIRKGVEDYHQSIAFPVIGCGKIGHSIDVISQVLIEEADRHRQLLKHRISVLFVSESGRTDIYDRFQQQIFSLESFEDVQSVSITVKKGRSTVEQENITTQEVIFHSKI